MGQFDSETDAALTQLAMEELGASPGSEFAEIISDLLALLGTSGPLGIVGGASNLLLKIRRLAGAGYTSNLVYAMTAVRNDLTALYERYDHLRERIETLATEPQFSEVISAMALQAMRTSVKSRLGRLARIVVNGVRHNDLNVESMDDMLRAATELTEKDIAVLKAVAVAQKQITIYSLTTTDGTINLPREVWQQLESERFITPADQMVIRSSLARLQSLGFGSEIQTMDSSWLPRFLPTPDGEKFLAHLEAIAAENTDV